MIGDFLDRAIRKRNCSRCNKGILPGEMHLRVYQHIKGVSINVNICKKCLINMANRCWEDYEKKAV